MASRLVIGGRYQLLNCLGGGGGGRSVVWHGHDQLLDRAVAVKLVADAATDVAGRALARVEARTAARLSHPHICQVYDYGDSRAESGEQVVYIAMELLSGSTLADRLRAGHVPMPVALRVCAQVASALAAAHSRGLVHRDLRPDNVRLTPAGPKIVDFGITAAATSVPDRPGTPAQLAPERLIDGTVTPASDVYALGLVLYRMVSGTAPWPAETVAWMLEAHQYQEPAPLPPVDWLPRPVVDLCQRCLAKDPRERPTAHEVARRLARAIGWHVSRAGEQLTEAAPVGPAAPPMVRPATNGARHEGDHAHPSPDRRGADVLRHWSTVPRSRRGVWDAAGN